MQVAVYFSMCPQQKDASGTEISPSPSKRLSGYKVPPREIESPPNAAGCEGAIRYRDSFCLNKAGYFGSGFLPLK